MEIETDYVFMYEHVPLEIIEMINNTFEILNIRAAVGETHGIKFQVRTNEGNHSIPHVHAKYNEFEISIAIDTGEVLAGNLPPKNQRIAVDWVIKNKKRLLTEWKNISISATSNSTISRITGKVN